jgi:hypothetical protein
MAIDKLDLLSKGWTTAEINHASKILEEAEDKKGGKIKFADKALIAIMILLMIGNGFACAIILVPFIYTIKGNFILALASIIGLIFSALFSIIIYDMERIHHKSETNLFVAFIVNGIINFYLIIEATARFGATSTLPIDHNIYYIAGAYLAAFLIPQILYQMSKRKIIDVKV